ncbi:hypothetical protein XU18_3540 [Perkinsela sp. CCAP 1560/4]|nr:hypothetical protein XU18_3540 [Perkinsela sp. CCAP 1560/4]|eukprot:KNH05569.1 hypothetical protein XU18_3540 [Perkinsela sp. CCAP 1560/4]
MFPLGSLTALVFEGQNNQAAHGVIESAEVFLIVDFSSKFSKLGTLRAFFQFQPEKSRFTQICDRDERRPFSSASRVFETRTAEMLTACIVCVTRMHMPSVFIFIRVGSFYPAL